MTIERLIIVGNFSSQKKNQTNKKNIKKQKFKTLLEHLAEIF